MPIKKKCLICGEVYFVKPSRERKSKFCSVECSHLSKIGKPSWNKGLTKDTNKIVKKMSEAKLNEKNPLWKGDNVGVGQLHEWVKRRKPKPKNCLKCEKENAFDLANISGKYKRDINDFEWLCRKCHMEKDGRMKNLFWNKGGKL